MVEWSLRYKGRVEVRGDAERALFEVLVPKRGAIEVKVICSGTLLYTERAGNWRREKALIARSVERLRQVTNDLRNARPGECLTVRAFSCHGEDSPPISKAEAKMLLEGKAIPF